MILFGAISSPPPHRSPRAQPDRSQKTGQGACLPCKESRAADLPRRCLAKDPAVCRKRIQLGSIQDC